jgi:hypothetical protein
MGFIRLQKAKLADLGKRLVIFVACGTTLRKPPRKEGTRSWRKAHTQEPCSIANSTETNHLCYYLDKCTPVWWDWVVMSALFPAPAPKPGVHWTDLLSHLEFVLQPCCLSYKQSAFPSTLCFHHLTNCFFRKSFIFTTICVAPWCRRVSPYFAFLLTLCLCACVANPILLTLAASFSLLGFFFAPVAFSDLQPLFAKHRGWGLPSVLSVAPWPIRGGQSFACESIQCLT